MFYCFCISIDNGDCSIIYENMNEDNAKEYFTDLQKTKGIRCIKEEESVYKIKWYGMRTEIVSDSKEKLEKFKKKILINSL